MADKPTRSRLFDYALMAAAMLLVVQLFLPKEEVVAPQPGLRISVQDPTVRGGHHPILVIQNVAASSSQTGWTSKARHYLCIATHFGRTASCAYAAPMHTGEVVTLPSRCPMPPVDVFFVEQSGETETFTPLTTTETAIPCEALSPIQPGQSVVYSLAPWQQSLFGRFGMYELRVPGTEKTASGTMVQAPHPHVARLLMSEPNVIVKVFRTFVTKPFLNFLIFTAGILPGHSLGWSIIILTILVKLLLFIPSQHAMEGQKKMQLLQPKLEALRKQYKDDQVKMQQETLRIWKEHKINPFSSCLPILLQFPILIGLFYVIRDGSNLDLSRHLIYPFYQHIDWTFDTHFFGLDLRHPSYLFPPILFVLQFIQMKLSFMVADRKKKDKEATPTDPMQAAQQKIMLYALPAMIAFFGIQFPAAVSLYWAVSTVFAIGQQMIVNREHLKV